MVDFRPWSLLGQEVQIRILRYFGGFVDGIYVRTLNNTINTYASAQPYKTIDADQLLRPEKGENVEKRLILFLNEKLYLDDEATNTLADFELVPPILPPLFNQAPPNAADFGGVGPSPTQEVNDLVVIDGRPWKPISINDWNFGNIPHYRAVLRLFDGF